MKVKTACAFEVDAEAIADGLDESADLGRLRCSRQESEDPAFTLGERTGACKPIEALLKRRGIWRRLAGHADRRGAPRLPTRRLHRRFVCRPSTRRVRSGGELRQAQ